MEKLGCRIRGNRVKTLNRIQSEYNLDPIRKVPRFGRKKPKHFNEKLNHIDNIVC